MLPSSKRLTTTTYLPVILRGMSFHSRSILLKLSRVPNSPTRAAATVSKKVGKTAVARNHIKRRLYSILTRFNPVILPNYYIILVAKPGIQQLSFTELAQQVRELLITSGVIANKQVK